MSLEQVEQQALNLSQPERAALAKKLLESLDDRLDDVAQAEYDKLAAEEAERRYAEIKSGKVNAVSNDAVFEKLRKRFQ